jgi:hypothetical protein
LQVRSARIERAKQPVVYVHTHITVSFKCEIGVISPPSELRSLQRTSCLPPLSTLNNIAARIFADISQVPKRAISMSARQILKAKEILAVVPDRRKAQAVKACFEGEISPMAPASILRRHPDATVYLDTNSASLLGPELQTMLKADSRLTVTY